MKIYEPKPQKVYRLTIRNQKESPIRLSLTDTTLEEIERYVKSRIIGNASVIAEGYRTSVDIRESIGKVNGKSKSISFFGLSVLETHELITKNLKKTDVIQNATK